MMTAMDDSVSTWTAGQRASAVAATAACFQPNLESHTTSAATSSSEQQQKQQQDQKEQQLQQKKGWKMKMTALDEEDNSSNSNNGMCGALPHMRLPSSSLSSSRQESHEETNHGGGGGLCGGGGASKKKNNNNDKRPGSKPLGFMKTILGECLVGCDVAFPTSSTAMSGYPPHKKSSFAGKNPLQGGFGGRVFGANPLFQSQSQSQSKSSLSSPQQFVQLQGLQYIGLGALEDELTARERVYDTLEQLTVSRTDRLISIGYLVEQEETMNEDGVAAASTTPTTPTTTTKKVTTQSIPYDVWCAAYPNDRRSMPRPIRRMIEQIQARNFDGALNDLRKTCAQQTRNPSIHNGNAYLRGITLHNMGVVAVLTMNSSTAGGSAGGSSGNDQTTNAALSLFEQAVSVKKETFGRDHCEVAISLNEIGIQLFAMERYEEALTSFSQSLSIWRNQQHHGYDRHHHGHHRDQVGPDASGPSTQLRQSMILNNIACCQFQMRNLDAALLSMTQAIDLLQHDDTSHQRMDNPDGSMRDEKKAEDNLDFDDCNSSTKDPIYQRKGSGGTEARADLDLLHRAIVLNNSGYLKVSQKEYDEARACFEEALLIQQSVLGDAHKHRAIRDSRANLEFTNVFHSE